MQQQQQQQQQQQHQQHSNVTVALTKAHHTENMVDAHWTFSSLYSGLVQQQLS